MIYTGMNETYYEVTDPLKFSKASGYLWNEKMMIHVNCRGYVVSQFMQPEPAKYSKGPMLEAKTFMQPEQMYFTEHPGRFVFVKDEAMNIAFSTPYEPMKTIPDEFKFIIEKDRLLWRNQHLDLEVTMILNLPKNDVRELWTVQVKNTSNRKRRISIYPYFTVGYLSWMNQSGRYDESLKTIICSSVTPYQKYQDYYKMTDFKDITFLSADRKPDAWEVNYENFIGEGGLFNPSSLYQKELMKGDAIYEMPTAVMQYRLEMEPGDVETYHFVFGPANNVNEIEDTITRYFSKADIEQTSVFRSAIDSYKMYIESGKGCIEIETPDKSLDNFVNHWLPRQLYYHGSTNRLTTDPQTRNYLQDNMGMNYINPSVTRKAFLTTLSQQKSNGAMPDGILLSVDAELKYINQVPHTDHCTWLSICMKAYLDETNDYDFLNERISFADEKEEVTVFDHMVRAMNWLIEDRNDLGLNYIRQGDWCDPMNMVGCEGKGVSGWLTLATSYAIRLWAEIAEEFGDTTLAQFYREKVLEVNQSVNAYLWDGNWYARGITDGGTVFGVSKDSEGKIFLNPQSFAILSHAANDDKKQKIVESVKEYLETPYGFEMLAPAYTRMREDVGRVTQKFPGSAENGAIYNHAAAFFGYAMYTIGNGDEGYNVFRKMIPGPTIEDLIQREQLPVFVPNYYRGAYEYYERTCGKSSQLFNTGTSSWFYRSIVEGMFGLIGCKEGLIVKPQLPSKWKNARVKRRFRGAEIDVNISRGNGIDKKSQSIYVDGQLLEGHVIKDICKNRKYSVEVYL
jgi:cellobionic acid phosphorylase